MAMGVSRTVFAFVNSAAISLLINVIADLNLKLLVLLKIGDVNYIL